MTIRNNMTEAKRNSILSKMRKIIYRIDIAIKMARTERFPEGHKIKFWNGNFIKNGIE
jgi:hypothetical protein